MKVNDLNSNNLGKLTKPEQGQEKKIAEKRDDLTNNKISDRLEISKEAHQLQEETLVQTDLNEIREKVEKGYYNDPAIIEKVTELILKEIAG